MDLSNLQKIVTYKAKRVGRGIGSGKGGHTSGRGSKGQKARGDVPIIFEGTKIKKSFIKRLPLLRGRGKFKPWGKKFVIINLRDLANWGKEIVSPENLLKSGLVKQTGNPIKVLGDGEVKSALEFKGLTVSKSAQKKIETAGGKVTE